MIFNDLKIFITPIRFTHVCNYLSMDAAALNIILMLKSQFKPVSEQINFINTLKTSLESSKNPFLSRIFQKLPKMTKFILM